MPRNVLLGLSLTVMGTTALLLLIASALIAQMLAAILAPIPFIGGWVARHLRAWAQQWLSAAGHIWDSHLYYVADMFRIIWAYFSSFWDGIYSAINNLRLAIQRVSLNQIPRTVSYLKWWVRGVSDADRAFTLSQIAGVNELIAAVYKAAQKFTMDRFTQAEADLSAGLRAETAYVNMVRKSVIKQVDNEAAAGYRAVSQEHQTLIGRILDLLVTHDPAVKGLVSKLAGMILDLIELDQPELRIAAGFIVRELVNHFGIDTMLGSLLHDVMAPLVGDAPPATLTDTIADVCRRLDALEAFRETFTADGGQDLLGLGQFLQSLDSAAMNLAMLGFLTAAVVDPVTTARETADVAEPLATAAGDALKALLGL